MFTCNRVLCVLPLVLVCASTFKLMRELRGPPAATAYRWVFGESAPDYVSSLKSGYYSHLKGYGLYLGFVVPPDRLGEVVDVESSLPLFRPELDYIEPWRHENQFRILFPENPPV